MSQKCQKQAEVKWDGVINQQHYNSSNLNTENLDALKTLRINKSRP